DRATVPRRDAASRRPGRRMSPPRLGPPRPPERPKSPRELERLLARGVEHYRKGRVREAAAAFHEALSLDPDNAQAHELLQEMLNPPVGPISKAPAGPPSTGWDEGPTMERGSLT